MYLRVILGMMILCGGARAFAPTRALLPSNGAKCFSTVMTSSPQAESASVTVRDLARRRLIAGSAAALLAMGESPAPANAIFGIGEEFQVYKEEEEDVPQGEGGYPLYGSKSIMKKRRHGTSDKPAMKDLRWGCDHDLADKICNFNRHKAERAGYFARTRWLKEVDEKVETTYYDSVTGKPLFVAPRGRTFDDFVKESKVHGWPSFRDEEVVWDNVRCLRDGECVSLTGTHLGHNLPDKNGNRYCINLVSVAGLPLANPSSAGEVAS